MLACPGCGSNLTYNIDKGRLFCEYCRSDYEPADKRLKQTMASEGEMIDAKIFTCPQCGGEMYTTDVDATAYCSYCGASNVLQSRVEGIDAPQKIIPFSVTRDRCISTFNKLAKGTLYAPREFRSGSGEGKLRPLYVPYRIFNISLDGKATIYGKRTELEGAHRYSKDCRIDCMIDADFKDLAYDASSGFDDTLAEQIAPFDMKEAQDFDSVYLAGGYANIPDVDEETYHKKALEYVAQKSIDTLGKSEVFASTDLTDYPDGTPLTDHLPVKEETSYIALLPVWFMSFRRGNRIAYAAVNGASGKVYSDIPISLPAFWIGSLVAAVPIFGLLQLFVTLQPKNGLFAACILALAGAVLYSGSYISILRREGHLDDAGYQFRGAGGVRAAEAAGGPDGAGATEAGGIAEGAGAAGSGASGDVVQMRAVGAPDGAMQTRAVGAPDDAVQTRAAGAPDGGGSAAGTGSETNNGAISRFGRWVTGRDRVPAVRVKRNWVYYAFKAFSIWPYIVMLILTALFAPTVFGAVLTAGCAIYCSRKGGGKISFWSWLLIGASAAGLVMRELPLVSDLWYYGGTVTIFLIVLVALTRLVSQYNLLSTRPLPLLFKDGKVPGNEGKDGSGSGKGGSSGKGSGSGKGGRSGKGSGSGKGGSGGAMSGLLLLVAGALVMQLVMPFGVKADGTPDGVVYTNSGTGYCVVINDQEDLLTEDEESRLLEQMKDLTRYGNAVFVSCSQTEYSDTADYAKNWYFEYFGNESGTALMIDMGQRMIALYSAGANYKVVGREEGYVITDNIYTYASKGDYYGCAKSAFEQVQTLLVGGEIARPMKYINNALLALILSVLINYGIISAQAAKRRAGRAMVSGDENYEPKVKPRRWTTINTVKALSFTGICTVILRLIIESALEGGGGGGSSSGGGGSSHGGGGFSGGGHASGGGGSHRF